jgi:hypothetical protein
MRVHIPGQRNHATTAAVVAGVVLAGLAAAGCSLQSAASRASGETCPQFLVEAIRHHVTVTSLPPACRGLTRVQVNIAVGSALHQAAAGPRGKVRQRERILRLSHFLDRLVTVVPEQRSQPLVPAPAARPASRTALGVIAACTWLITAGLGLWMMARWIGRGRRRRAPAGQPQRPPALNFAHFGLATAGLLAWIAYLAAGVAGVAWTACALLLPAASLGMALVFLPPASRPAASATTGHAVPGGMIGVLVRDDPSHVRHPPVLVVSAHIIFATATILLAFLTAIGTG